MNRAPFPSATGPSQIAHAFYLHGDYTPPRPQKPPKPEPKPLDVEALKAYRARRKSQAECAVKFGISVEAVRKALGAPLRTQVKRHDLTHAKALGMRLNGCTLREIGKAYGVSVDTARLALCEKGLPFDVQQKIKAAFAAKKIPRMRDHGLRLSEGHRKIYRALGGAAWLRNVLDEKMRGKV